MGANGLVRRSSSNLAWYNGSADQTVYTSPDDGAWHHLRVTPTDLYFDGRRIQNTTSLANINNEGVAGNNPGLMAVGAYRDSGSGILYNGAVIFGLVRIMPGVDLGSPTVPITTNGSLSSSETIPTDGIIIRNGNTVATNFNPFTANINTQRGKQSGYCTLNPLKDRYNIGTSGTKTFSEGNLRLRADTGDATRSRYIFGTVGVSTGKWYYEATVIDKGGEISFGIADDNAAYESTTNLYYYLTNGNKNVSGSGSSYGSAASNGDIIGIAFDLNSRTIEAFKNGISMGIISSSLNSGITYFPILYIPVISTTAAEAAFNFGQKPFKFPPPAGFQPLALANTPRPTIVRPDQFVGVSTWSGAQSGSGGLTRQISLGMQPDFVWIKQRNQAYSTGHQLYDSVRGAGAEKELNSSGTGAEGAGNIETYGWLNSFDKTGFTVKGGSSDYDYVDKSGVTYVGWAWKAGGNSNTFNINDVGYATASDAGLTAGTITPTGASVNTKSGFSIITYTGTGSAATISHGLGKAPAFYITKARTSSGFGNWTVYHSSVGTQFLELNGTGGASSDSTRWPSAADSSVINIGSNGNVNQSTYTFVAYCWAEIPGFSKFGSAVTNASTDGVFVWTGFKPRFIILKQSSTTSGWLLIDTTRSPYNVATQRLEANTSTAEDNTYNLMDVLSNGFKLRSTAYADNGATFVYAAFAETPTQNLYGAQSNAR